MANLCRLVLIANTGQATQVTMSGHSPIRAADTGKEDECGKRGPEQVVYHDLLPSTHLDLICDRLTGTP